MDAYLLDTCTVIPLLRIADPRAAKIRAQLDRLDQDGSSAGISVITVSELEFSWGRRRAEGGVVDETEIEKVSRFVDQRTIYRVDTETARIHAKVRGQLFATLGTRRSNNKPRETVPEALLRFHGQEIGIDERDLLIVATALQYNLILATQDSNAGMEKIADAVAACAMRGVTGQLRLAKWV